MLPDEESRLCSGSGSPSCWRLHGPDFTGRYPAPRKWSPFTAAALGRQHDANHIYLFIRTTLERCLIAFSHWTDPCTNEGLIGTDRGQDQEWVINGENQKDKKMMAWEKRCWWTQGTTETQYNRMRVSEPMRLLFFNLKCSKIVQQTSYDIICQLVNI